MDGLVQWLREQLDEDERIARAATPGPWHIRHDGVVGDDGEHWPVAYTDSYRASEDCLHVAEHDPARVLREIDAKRHILARACEALNDAGSPDYLMRGPACMSLVELEPIVKTLATVYADRCGYREEWRP
ncbi:DUF6221 family protein [Streptomyces sp. NPDC001939]